MKKIRYIFLMAILLLSPGIIFSVELENDVPKSKVEAFFLKVQNNQEREAFNELTDGNPFLFSKGPEATKAIEDLKKFAVNSGKVVGYEIVRNDRIAARIAYLYVICFYENQPIRYEFMFYKTNDKWVFYNISYAAEFYNEIRFLLKAPTSK